MERLDMWRKNCWKKGSNLEEKVKQIEGAMLVVRQPDDNFTFQVGTSQVFLTHTSNNDWVINYGCIYHMAKDSSLFSLLDKVVVQNIYVDDDLSLDIDSNGDFPYQDG